MIVDVDARDLDTGTERFDELFTEFAYLEYRDSRAEGDIPAFVPGGTVLGARVRPMVNAGAFKGRRRMTSLSLAPARMNGTDWRQTARRRPANSAAVPTSRFEVVRSLLTIERRTV